MLTLETIKRIIDDIKADDEWVQDSHDHAEKRGVDRGLDILYRHAEILESHGLRYRKVSPYRKTDKETN